MNFVSYFKGDIEVPMDSNWGWLVVLASFIVQMLALGFIYSYSVFYNVFSKEFEQSASATSAIGALMTALNFGTGMFVGPLCDRVGFRRLVFIGSIPVLIGFIGSSFATNLVMLYIFFGVFIGVGCGICYLPGVAIVPTFFDKKRSFAVGIAFAGSGVGNAIIGPMCRNLVIAVGWRNAVRILGGLWCFLFLVAGCLMRRRIPLNPNAPKKPYRVLDVELFRDPAFQMFGLAVATCSCGFFAPFTYILAFAKESGGFTDTSAQYLMTIMGISSTTGRVVFGRIGDSGLLSRLSLAVIATAAIGLSSILFPWMVSIQGLVYFYACFFGMFAGAFIATQAVLAAEYWGLEKLGLTMGNMFACNIPGMISGPPLFGIIFDKMKKYDAVYIGAGTCLTLTSIFLALVPWALRRRDRLMQEKMKDGLHHFEFAAIPLSSPPVSRTTSEVSQDGGIELSALENGWKGMGEEEREEIERKGLFSETIHEEHQQQPVVDGKNSLIDDESSKVKKRSKARVHMKHSILEETEVMSESSQDSKASSADTEVDAADHNAGKIVDNNNNKDDSDENDGNE